jgi:hypothetical protein
MAIDVTALLTALAVVAFAAVAAHAWAHWTIRKLDRPDGQESPSERTSG